MAANETSYDEYTAEEKNALSIFRSHAEKLHDLEDERAEQGRLYVEQQFSKNSNRAEAQKTKNRMDILDGQIQREEEALLSACKCRQGESGSFPVPWARAAAIFTRL